MEQTWHQPYSAKRTPLMARNVVATSHHLASQAGLRILSQGGNAVDAALAAAAALTICEPMACGLGGDAFAIVWDGHGFHGLNGSGAAPKAWSYDYFQKRHNGAIPKHGWDSVTVPGVVSAWTELSAKLGRLPLTQILAPAIELAESGYVVGPALAHMFESTARAVAGQPGFYEAFTPNGRVPKAGDLFVFKSAGQTLQEIAATNGRSFYEGDLARRIVAHSTACGGSLSFDDLSSHRSDWVEPISSNYRGFTVHELPPNGQGIAALMALGILENFDMAALGVDTVESVHLQIEAMKLAFSDVYGFVASSESMKVPVQALLDKAYLAQRAALIDPARASRPSVGNPVRGDTVYVTAADAEGMIVSLIQSTFTAFGSGVVVPGTGICLQNRGSGFSMDRNHPNCVQGGKRPFHTIIPGFLSNNGDPLMAFGVIGANMQPQGHVQALVRLLDFHQSLAAVCDAPRWRITEDGRIAVESLIDPILIDGLRVKGHDVFVNPDSVLGFGVAQYALRSSVDGYIAASDWRRDGQAVGF